MTEAIEVVYPQTLHQTCIVHLIRADIIRFSEGQSGRVQGAQAHLSSSGCRRCRTCSGAF
nr:hypothetical protein [Sutterella wadsworthensis]